jgi:hypothetical protein
MIRPSPSGFEGLLAAGHDLLLEWTGEVLLYGVESGSLVPYENLERRHLGIEECGVIAVRNSDEVTEYRSNEDLLDRFLRSLPKITVIQPLNVRVCPLDHLRIPVTRPILAPRHPEDLNGIRDLDHDPKVKHSHIAAALVRSAHRLSPDKIRKHACIRIEKEVVDEFGGVLGRIRIVIQDGSKCIVNR